MITACRAVSHASAHAEIYCNVLSLVLWKRWCSRPSPEQPLLTPVVIATQLELALQSPAHSCIYGYAGVRFWRINWTL